MGKRILLVSLLMLALCVLASCGSKNIGLEEYPSLAEASHASSGVTLGGFEVIRLNEAGNADASLNGTLSLRLEDGALVISVNDSERTTAVALDVSYDANEINPERAEFTGLLGDDTQVLSLSVLSHAERIALAEAAIRDYTPGALNGDFAKLYYTAGLAKNVSAMGNFAHSNPAGVAEVIQEVPNLVGTSDTDAGTATVTWTAGWHIADGDSNSEVNGADIVPISQKFGSSTGTDWSSVRTDYDRNTETGAPDLQPIALYYTNKTVEYIVEASDDVEGAARTTVGTVNFVTDAQDPVTPVAAGDLTTVFPWYQIEFNDTSALTYDALAALDTGGTDGTVRVWITPSYPAGNTTTGVESSVDLEVGEPIPPKDNIIVTAFTVSIAGADNGSGGTNFGATGGTAATAPANGALTLTLESISGTFNALAFSEGDLPDPGDEDPMTTADYDLVFNTVRDALVWDIDHTGDSGSRRTADWLVLDTDTFPKTGDPNGATVFPDDDPESEAPTDPEGSLTVGITAGTYLPTDAERNITVSAGDGTLDYTISCDVTADLTAPEIDIYGTTLGGPELTMVYGENNVKPMEIFWGSGGAPVDYSTVQLQLIRMDGQVVDEAGGLFPYDFTYTTGDPGVGEFTIVEPPEGGIVVLTLVPGVYVTAGSTYVFRINTGVWSSINKPEDVITTSDPPAPEKLLTVPPLGHQNIDTIAIMYENPIIRRSSRLTFNLASGSVDPVDPAAYADILKQNGSEFNIAVAGSFPKYEEWPKFGLQEVLTPSIDGSEVTSWANDTINPDPDVDNSVNVAVGGREKDRIVIDVATITPPTDPGDPTKYYVYKLFNSDGSTLGWGNFEVAPMGLDEAYPTALNWAVNAWDREEADFATSLFSGKTIIDGSSIVTSQPDVLWFHWSDGYFTDTDQDPTSVNPSNQNVRILATDNNTAATMQMELGLKLVGLGTTEKEYVAIHTPTNADWANPGQAGWTGIFRQGRTYTLEIRDPAFATTQPQGTYANVLVVTGSNPNV